jgi:hypothetical protein
MTIRVFSFNVVAPSDTTVPLQFLYMYDDEDMSEMLSNSDWRVNLTLHAVRLEVGGLDTRRSGDATALQISTAL